MDSQTAVPTSPPTSYSAKKDRRSFIVLALILGFIIFTFKYWMLFCFNTIMTGYFLFSELRGATIFFAVILRILLYPLGYVKRTFDKRIRKAEEEFRKEARLTNNPLLKDKLRREWLSRNKKIVFFDWFYFCFYSMNAFVVGWIFLQPFTQARINQGVLFDFLVPKFPMTTESYIPLVGMADLTKINMTLNFLSAVGAFIVGIFEVTFHKKTRRKDLLMYLVMFPLGAYFITMWVPSGFEFSLIVFEILTVGIIIVEKITESKVFKFFKPPVEEEKKGEE